MRKRWCGNVIQSVLCAWRWLYLLSTELLSWLFWILAQTTSPTCWSGCSLLRQLCLEEEEDFRCLQVCSVYSFEISTEFLLAAEFVPPLTSKAVALSSQGFLQVLVFPRVSCAAREYLWFSRLCLVRAYDSLATPQCGSFLFLSARMLDRLLWRSSR